MRVKYALVFVFLTLFLAAPHLAISAPVHNFDCKTCHLADKAFVDLDGNICLSCHGTGVNLKAASGFLSGDASNQYGNNPAPGDETSHHWAATSTNPAAGASEPYSYPGFYSNYGTSVGKVTCTRCHQPHGDEFVNPQLLTSTASGYRAFTAVPMEVEQMCEACHSSFAAVTSGQHGLLSHPVGMNYNSVVATQPDAYKATIDNGTAGEVQKLTDGSIGCVTCHGVHATDSNANTADKFNTATLGDGLLLKHNGPGIEDPNAGTQGICQACHLYEGHGSTLGGNAIGCMVCHGGHSYDATAPNYYMLNKEITLDVVPATGLPGTVTLDYTVDPTLQANYDNGTGTFGAICLSCHALPGTHNSTDACAGCHSHDSTTGSFAAGCGSCHGYAPYNNDAGNLGTGGYAVSTANPTHDYSTSGVFKDESATPHDTHTNGSGTPGNYAFSCFDCHGDGSGNLSDLSTDGNHDGGTFQQVLDTGIGSLTSLTTGNGRLAGGSAPNYAEGGSGSCSNVYCHSNGVANRADNTLVPVAATPWAAGDGTISTCTACHDIGGVNDTPTHDAHISNYACSICHADTAVDAGNLTASAIGTTHVNGQVDAVFSGIATNGITTTYDDTTGTCATYCHSSGQSAAPAPVQNPDWDVAATGQCGDCHGIDSVSPDQLSGAHAAHFNQGITTCNTCHTHDGSTVPAGTGVHIDGTIDLTADVCNTCHGAVAGNNTVGDPDRVPVWTDATSVDCETCHAGTAISNIAAFGVAPDKNSALTTGHNLDSGNYAVSGNTAANQSCTDCHDAAAAGHFDAAGDNRLVGGFDCATCHTTIVTHQAQSCTNCHDVHGTSNIYMVRGDTVGATGTVVFSATTGADSYDEDDGAVGGAGEDNADDICATCHTVAGGTAHNNSDNSAVTHWQGTDCFNCHLPHTNPGNAFAVGGGDSCDSCHGYPPNTDAHTAHAPDSFILDGAGKVYRDATNGFADVSSCEYCHTDASSYTYNTSTDIGNGLNHSNAAGRVTILGTAVGYDGNTCASACHDGASGVAANWTDASLACDACHYQSATPTQAGNTADTNTISAGHNAHFNSSAVCTDCHAATADTSHITDRSGADEAAKIQGMATALQDEAGLLGALTFDDVANTCATASCHNDARPGNDVLTAAWGTDQPNCTQCHAAAPSTGSHDVHIPDATDCSDCHTSALQDTSYNSTEHYDGNIDVAIGSYPTNKAINSAFTTCDAPSCHDDGRAPTLTPVWGTSVTTCLACHEAVPSTGSHTVHVADGAVCADCHTDAVQETTAPSTGHRDGNIDTIAGLGYTQDKALGSAETNCTTASCHNDGRNGGVTGTWGTTINDCAECHATVPATGGHGAHVGVSFGGATIACGDCHTGAVEGTTAPTANHRDGDVNATGGYPVQAIGSAFATCTTATCHQTGQATNDYTETPAWDVDAANCTQCHEASPTTNSHPKHLVVTSGSCSGCHTNAVANTSYADANHGDLNIDVAVGGYTADKAIGSALESCSINCHSDGISAVGTSPVWGTAGGACDVCHLSDMVTGSHGPHLADGALCGDCHDGAVKDSNPGTAHTDGDVDVIATYATPNAAYGTATWTTCSAASCHDDGRAPNVTAAWGTTVNNCAECHATQPATGSHTAHLAASVYGAAIACGDCHTGVTEGTTANATDHRDTNIDTTTALGYTQNKALGSAFESCATVNCHSNGLTATGSTPVWGNAGDCATCHASNMASGSHTAHLEAGAACGDCHDGAIKDSNPGTAHIDGNVDAIAGYATANAAYGSTTWTTCNAASCHDDGTGSIVTTPDWGTASACNECHLDNMVSNSHGDHLNTTISANTISCGSCHGDAVKATSAATGVHLDGNVDVYDTTAGDLGYPTSNPKGDGNQSCSTTYCHGDTLAYSAGDGIDTSPLWGATLGTDPNNCDVCHGYPPNGGGSHPSSASCVDCHDHVNATNNGFADVTKHIDGTVQVTGGDTCTDCHGGGAYRDPDSGDHSVHTDADTVLAGKGLTAGDYGSGAWWYEVTYDAIGRPQMGCGQCHPATEATHLNTTVDTDLDPAGETIASPNAKLGSQAGATYTSGTGVCSNVYCHSNGAGSFADSPSWNITAGDAGVTCASCHGNSPTTNAHGVHEVGIHYEELYDDDGVGLMAVDPTGLGASGGADSAHGNSATSSTINCFTCHNGTVTDSANADNSTCTACHSDTNSIVTGDELARIAASSSVHLNGRPDVSFADLSTFKSKAQLRDNLADADDGSNILSAIWNRIVGYKPAAGTGYDTAQAAFSTPSYDGSGGCSTVVCHNGNTATWTDSGVDCMYCHTSLPK